MVDVDEKNNQKNMGVGYEGPLSPYDRRFIAAISAMIVGLCVSAALIADCSGPLINRKDIPSYLQERHRAAWDNWLNGLPMSDRDAETLQEIDVALGHIVDGK